MITLRDITLLAIGLIGLNVSPARNRADSASARTADREDIGPSTRRSPFVVSEIMSHPDDREDGKDLEFLEIYNSNPWPESVGGFRIRGEADYDFEDDAVIPGKGFLVIAKSPDDLMSVYPEVEAKGPYRGRINNRDGTIRLVSRHGAIQFEVNYRHEPPWPVGANGGGHSLVLARPSYGENDPRSWAISDRRGGSPGRDEDIEVEDLRAVVINEWSAFPEDPEASFVELYNYSPNDLDISNCLLTDLSDGHHAIPQGTTIAAGGYYVVTPWPSGSPQQQRSSIIYLYNSAGTRVLDAVQGVTQIQGHSRGRFPNGSSRIRELLHPTAGISNAKPLVRDIVINEIMYHPISENSNDEYVELLNQGDAAIDLGGWRFTDGIEFTFPAATIMAPGQLLVVARDKARFLDRYRHLSADQVVGDYEGVLSNRGERLALAMPLSPIGSSTGNDPLEPGYLTVDEVQYQDGEGWGRWADGWGSSLELIDPRTDNQLAVNWTHSDESQKAAWTDLSATAQLTPQLSLPRSAQILLTGPGECLVDEVRISRPNQDNMVRNSGFEDAVLQWRFLGNHVRSSVVLEMGVSQSQALYLRASARGDTHSNHISNNLNRGIRSSDEIVFAVKARWLRGHPELLVRFEGNLAEAAFTLDVPNDLGTPGQPNSEARDRLGPAIWNVRHEPILPPAGVRPLVTARVEDPDGLARVTLRFRQDRMVSSESNTAMTDDGAGADRVAGDGVFSAYLPAQPARQMTAFFIESEDLSAAPSLSLYPANAPAGHEMLVRFGEEANESEFGAYHIWVASDQFQEWRSRSPTSNEPLNASFVYNGQRVIHSIGARYAGSPFNSPDYDSPTGHPCDYHFLFPSENRFLNAKKIILSWPGLTGFTDPTLQHEQFCYWVASELGLPFNYRRYVQVFVNGTKRAALMEDTQRPDQDMLRQWFPNDSDGQLFKIQIRYESGAGSIGTSASLMDVSTPEGEKRTASYRWNWAPRGPDRSANEFSNLFALVDAVNAPDPSYHKAVTDLVDIEQWMRMFAMEHVVGNWDSYGYGNGQNMYAYKPTAGTWVMMPWDLDIGAGSSVGELANTTLFKLTNPYFPTVNGDSQIVGRMYRHPAFARACWRALAAAVAGPLQQDRADAFVDTRFDVFRAGQIRATAPTAIKSFVSARRLYIERRLNRVAVPVSLTSHDSLEFETGDNPVRLAGTAPVQIRFLRFNGIAYPVTWDSVTDWSVQLPLQQTGLNSVHIVGSDYSDQALEQAEMTLNIQFTGVPIEDRPTLLITEWLASNNASLADPADGDFEDWIEVHNFGELSVDLSGFYLSDDLSKPLKWAFPTGTMIGPRENLLIWADGEPNQTMAGQGLHSNFSLNRDGEIILLLDSQGLLIDKVEFGAQTADVSQGRIDVHASSALVFFQRPTPEMPNGMSTGDLRIIDIQRGPDGAISITWSAMSGARYQVQVTDRLDQPQWRTQIEEIIAVSAEASIDNLTATDAEQQFYRIVQKPL